MFCRIHKVGTTGLNHLLEALDTPVNPQKPSWRHFEASDYGLNSSDVSNLIKDPSWYKVVFYREPLERFLSAYRSKCEEFDRDGVCARVFHNKVPSFAGAIRRIIHHEEFSFDSHFAPQVNVCNLKETLPYFTGKFLLETSTSGDNMRRVLHDAHIEMTDKINEILNIYYAPIGSHSDGNHNTHSSNTSALLQYYHHDCFIRLVIHHYQSDYILFKIPLPEWAEGALKSVTVEHCKELIKSH